jgi:hypothetical protein
VTLDIRVHYNTDSRSTTHSDEYVTRSAPASQNYNVQKVLTAFHVWGLSPWGRAQDVDPVAGERDHPVHSLLHVRASSPGRVPRGTASRIRVSRSPPCPKTPRFPFASRCFKALKSFATGSLSGFRAIRLELDGFWHAEDGRPYLPQPIFVPRVAGGNLENFSARRIDNVARSNGQATPCCRTPPTRPSTYGTATVP